MSNTNNILALMRMKKLKSQEISAEEMSEKQSSYSPQEIELPAMNQKMMSSEKPAAPSKKPSMADMMRLCLTKKDSLDNTPR